VAALHYAPVQGNATQGLLWYDTATGPWGFVKYDHQLSALSFGTVNTERARIDSSGRLLVGTSSTFDQSARLQVIADTGTSVAANFYSYGADNSQFVIGAARGTVASPTTLNSSDTIGGVYFRGHDGTSFKTGAQIQAQIDGITPSSDLPSRLVFSTTADGASSPTERLRITSAGLVGIGTSSPTVLHLAGAGTTGVRVQNTSGNSVDIYAGTDGFINQSGSGTLNFQLAGSTKATLTSTGLGIGTVSPTRLLTVQSTGNANLCIKTTNTGVSQCMFGDTDSDVAGNIAYLHSADAMTFETLGTERARIDSSGRLLVGTSSARSNFFNSTVSAALQVEGTGNDTSSLSITRNSADVGRAILTLAKTRGGSVGSTTIVQSGDALGSIEFQGSDGTEFVQAAAIQCEVDGTPGANDMPGRLVFSTTADGASSPTERMRINSEGSVLVGTTTGSGSVSNSTPVVAGRFYSFNGSSSAVSSGSAITMFTAPNTNATYIVVARISSVQNASYEAITLLSANAG
jgi:hypothetical protein